MAAPQSRLLVFFGPDQYVDVRTSLFSSLDVQSLVRLSATCKQLHSDILALWDVNLRLCRFFGDVDTSKAFRSQLGRCNALIAGSFALQFFEGVLWTESDLDIEVQRGIDLTVLHEWVVGPVGGYTLSPVDKEKGSLSSEWRESKYNEDAWDEGLVWLHNDVVEVSSHSFILSSRGLCMNINHKCPGSHVLQDVGQPEAQGSTDRLQGDSRSAHLARLLYLVRRELHHMEQGILDFPQDDLHRSHDCPVDECGCVA